jgi:gamma-glutamyltranspeptidase / glutathione hydrolase
MTGKRLGRGKLGGHDRSIQGFNAMVSSTHYGATQAGIRILEAGGNAVDAGVAVGLCLGVIQCDIVNVGGVAPIIYREASGRITQIAGLGHWPKLASVEHFRAAHGGKIPAGILRTVVPAAPEAWITALREFGTMSFGEVASAAIAFARDGFAMYTLLANSLAKSATQYARWESSAAIYLPNGRPPLPGERFVQADLGRSLQYMADEERAAAAKGGRIAGLQAARDAFYRGDIAQKMVKFHVENGGWLRHDDLADYKVEVAPPVTTKVRGMELHTCGAWCQGPALPQVLKLLERDDLAKLGHNSPAYIHLLTEAVKLVFADRERYIGDPRHVDVPLDALLSDDYAAVRRGLIDMAKAWPEMPPAGDPRGLRATAAGAAPERRAAARYPEKDTSYVCTVDKAGNLFSATPSDGSAETPVIPGTGLIASSRGSQSFTTPGHASMVAPGRRPRLTPNPAIALTDDAMIAFGTPGGDVQTQAMAQVLLNVASFGMDVQAAIDAPRFASYSFPSSFEPHDYHPGLLKLEDRLPKETGAALEKLGHTIEWWPDFTWLAGAVCMIVAERDTGLRVGGADPRRHSSAAAT